MPSCAATRRASSTSETLQHPESDSPPQSFSVTPVTSCPCSSSSAAATDESTPPLMATSTRRPARRPARRSPCRSPCQAGTAAPRSPCDGVRDHLERAVDVGVGGREAEAQAHRGGRLRQREAHRGEHVRRLRGARRAGRTRRRAQALDVEGHEQCLGLHAVETDVRVPRDLPRPVAVLDGAGHVAQQGVGEAVAQPADANDVVVTPRARDAQCSRGGRDARDVRRARTQAAFLTTTLHERFQGDAVAHDEGTGPLGAPELVGRDRDQIERGGGCRDVEPGHCLHRVGVQHRCGARSRDERGDLVERLDRADLVVHEHHRHHDGVLVERVGQGAERHDAVVPDAHLGDAEALGSEPVRRCEHALVLEGGGHDAVAVTRGAGRARAPFTARLSASVPPAVNTSSAGAAPRSAAISSRASSSAVFAARAHRVATRRVAVGAREERRHRRHGLLAHRRGGGVVEVGDRTLHRSSVRAPRRRPTGGFRRGSRQDGFVAGAGSSAPPGDRRRRRARRTWPGRARDRPRAATRRARHPSAPHRRRCSGSRGPARRACPRPSPTRAHATGPRHARPRRAARPRTRRPARRRRSARADRWGARPRCTAARPRGSRGRRRRGRTRR